MVITDTGFWLALASDDDVYHAQAQNVLDRLQEPLITTWCVATEACYLLLTRIGNHAQVSFMNNLFTGGVQIFDLQLPHIQRMLQLMERYADLPIGSSRCVAHSPSRTPGSRAHSNGRSARLQRLSLEQQQPF
jgi:hypothetical protein